MMSEPEHADAAALVRGIAVADHLPGDFVTIIESALAQARPDLDAIAVSQPPMPEDLTAIEVAANADGTSVVRVTFRALVAAEGLQPKIDEVTGTRQQALSARDPNWDIVDSCDEPEWTDPVRFACQATITADVPIDASGIGRMRVTAVQVDV